MMGTGGYVDYIKANELEGEIRDLERELTLATLNDRYDDIESLKEEIRDKESELDSLYWY